ncbi:HAD-superfamily phosphatase, subfamily IIIC:FkbH [Streptomyces narbonensis]|uniref:HAD-IIIC family phosphatase n=1 Tax=Streptomyces narbonensis TaxID=67333 RepID=UPI001671BC11|nr:HAD-IIIC family phosphatase [Streptomyces narbonensis]GGV94194.1 HAD-superfamily phosphatase, subfamily IIIC:FkbH [Streptomyces narbonensis]
MTTVSSPAVRETRKSPLETLRALRADGTLAADYPSVAPLLAAMVSGGAESDLRRAGNLLVQLDRQSVLAARPETETAVVALTGHSTIGGVRAPLTAEFARHGVLVENRLGDFDSYLRDLRDPTSALHAPDVDLALWILDPQTLVDEMGTPWRADDLVRTAERKLAQIGSLATAFTRNSTAALVLNTVPLPRSVTHQLIDHESRARAGIAWRDFNSGLLRLALGNPRIHVVDLDPIVAAGVPLDEPRMAAYAKASLGDDLLAGYAREVAHLSRMLRGRTKKVLVVDADNTLWDGILGDDGPDGIAAATTFRGEAFGTFQRAVQQIGSQGILLAISSKNDHEPVVQVLKDHPDMVLRERDFARVNANWQPKDANLRDIAEKLNLGIDSFVFADDSPFECGLVADSLPQVAIVRLDEEPALHIEKLLADGWFDTARLTDEDRARAALYRTESERAELQENSGSLEEYLQGLGVRVRLTWAAAGDIDRVAQLSLRANQFNLTTVRLGVEDVTARAGDPDHLVLTIRSGDRFGDNGVVGAVFARSAADGTELHVDNMLLSCRVFARGIEQATVAALLAHARATGVRTVHASYRPTAKNRNVRDFWPSMGFASTSTTDDGLRFRHDLADLPAVPAHILLDSSLEGTAS